MIDEQETFYLKIYGKDSMFSGILDGCQTLGRVKAGDRVRLTYLDKDTDTHEIRTIAKIRKSINAK